MIPPPSKPDLWKGTHVFEIALDRLLNTTLVNDGNFSLLMVEGTFSQIQDERE